MERIIIVCTHFECIEAGRRDDEVPNLDVAKLMCDDRLHARRTLEDHKYLEPCSNLGQTGWGVHLSGHWVTLGVRQTRQS
jgi:hypothetical protein